jgi:hypothetical protein
MEPRIGAISGPSVALSEIQPKLAGFCRTSCELASPIFPARTPFDTCKYQANAFMQQHGEQQRRGVTARHEEEA